MATYRHTGVGNGVARTDYASLGQAQDSTAQWCGTATGTADALTLTPTPAITAYTAGQVFRFKSSASANTGPATVAISGLTTKAIQNSGSALSAGNIAANLWYVIVYDGAAFQLQKISVSAGDFLADGSVPMTGNLTLGGAGTGIIFEGTTADAFETTLKAGEPTADRDINLPDLSGTVALLEAIQAQTGVAYTTGGTSTAYTLTPTPALAALIENQEFDVEFHTAAGATPTLAISGLTAQSLKYRNSSGTLTAVTSTQIPSGWRSKVTYDGTDMIVREVPPASGGITLGTPVASTSGTAIDFTGIPSTAKRISILFQDVSLTGTSLLTVQIGDAGGIENTGYSGVGYTVGSSNATSTSGFPLASSMGAAGADIQSGVAVLTLSDTSNKWSMSSTLLCSTNGNRSWGTGYKATSATLDRVRITTAGGADTFDAGIINIAYE